MRFCTVFFTWFFQPTVVRNLQPGTLVDCVRELILFYGLVGRVGVEPRLFGMTLYVCAQWSVVDAYPVRRWGVTGEWQTPEKCEGIHSFSSADELCLSAVCIAYCCTCSWPVHPFITVLMSCRPEDAGWSLLQQVQEILFESTCWYAIVCWNSLTSWLFW